MMRSATVSWDRLRGQLADNGAHPDDLACFDAVLSRRRFLVRLGQASALATLTSFGAGTDAAIRGLFGRGLIPVSWADEAVQIQSKPGMIVHNDRPVNGEFPPHLLDDSVTPSARHFVRNNGLVPERADNKDLQGWALTVDGEVNQKLELSMADLHKFPAITLQATIECGGNGRALFQPQVRGNQWRRGAIGCSEWTGARLQDVLNAAGLKENAVYTGHYGEDPPIGTATPFSRGIPIDKAMDAHTLIAYKMNGEDLTALNGYPVRLVVPGWIGSSSEKWLSRIWVRDQVHDAAKMTGYSYRVPAYPVIPGTKPPEEDMVIATSWVIKSLITRPEADTAANVGQAITVGGHAWAGEDQVAKVLISTDFGISWRETKLTPPANKYAWYNWEGQVTFESKGYYEIWARAFDNQGGAQPFRQSWNPKGYLGNVIHRVPVKIGV